MASPLRIFMLSLPNTSFFFRSIVGPCSSSFIHSSSAILAGGNWREKKGMSRTGTSYGPLTDLPDWTYLDGSQAPGTLSKRKLKRKKKEEAIARRIKYLLKEVDHAKAVSQGTNADSDYSNDSDDNDSVKMTL